VNYVQADRATSVLDNQIAGGLSYAAPFDWRPNDTIAIAFGRTDYNSRAAQSILLANPGVPLPPLATRTLMAVTTEASRIAFIVVIGSSLSLKTVRTSA
jgi:hypothetical protein